MAGGEFYKRLKIAGMISFIPVVLAAGPLAGYFAGSYLEKKFGLGPFVSFFAIGLGSVASAIEVVKIIRRVVRIDAR